IYDDVVQVRVGRNSRLSVVVQRSERQRLVAKAARLAAVDEDSSGRDAQRRDQVVQQGGPVLLVGVDVFGVHFYVDNISRRYAQRFGKAVFFRGRSAQACGVICPGTTFYYGDSHLVGERTIFSCNGNSGRAFFHACHIAVGVNAGNLCIIRSPRHYLVCRRGVGRGEGGCQPKGLSYLDLRTFLRYAHTSHWHFRCLAQQFNPVQIHYTRCPILEHNVYVLYTAGFRDRDREFLVDCPVSGANARHSSDQRPRCAAQPYLHFSPCIGGSHPGTLFLYPGKIYIFEPCPVARATTVERTTGSVHSALCGVAFRFYTCAQDRVTVPTRKVSYCDFVDPDIVDNTLRKIKFDRKGFIISGCWFIDTDYNEESFFVRHAYFLGDNDPYSSLKTTLKAEINQEAWESLYSDTSRPFPKPKTGRIAVKVINHLGDEVMKVFRVE